jgi:hypothetical protein
LIYLQDTVGGWEASSPHDVIKDVKKMVIVSGKKTAPAGVANYLPGL